MEDEQEMLEKVKSMVRAKEIPVKEIISCNKIGLTSGASAPEKLVQSFISEIKKHVKVSIEESISSRENVTFKLPSSLIN